MSEQNFVDLMTQHRLKEICNVDNTSSSNLEMSSELSNATSTEFTCHQLLIVTHVGVKMNFNMCQKAEKGQIIKALALKRKMKCHFMKQGDYISEGGKCQSDSLFSFSKIKFQLFFVSIMNVEQSLLEKL
jgi:hypothetical protein